MNSSGSPPRVYSVRRQARLPQELFDHIIDSLSEDRQALKACSLASRLWLHRCRHHLHRSVTLYHQNCRIHFSQMKNISLFLTLPVVSEYTRELHLEGKTDYQQWQHNVDHQEEDDGTDLFWKVLARFSHVQTLRVKRLFWVSHPLDSKDRLCTSFPSVTDLDVYMSDFADSSEFLSFLSAFPRVTGLKVERVFWCRSATEWYNSSGLDPSSYRILPPDATPGAYLRRLQVQHCDVHIMVDIAKWLATLSSPRINSLYLSPPDGDDFGALPLYFRAIGPSLEHIFLTLEFDTKCETLRQGKPPLSQSFIPHSHFIVAIAGLESCSRLQSLTLSGNFALGRKFVKAANIFWPCVLIVLTHTASRRLHTVRFECQIEDLEAPALFEVDALLSDRAFASLSDVIFVLVDLKDKDSEETMGMLQTYLPLTASRGALRFHF